MQAHLASGCQKCRHTAELLRKVATAARRHSQVQVPDYALRCARAIFLLQQPEKVQILPRIPARLLYDSFREPLPAGVRTQQRLSRQALYQAGDYSLDLRLENESGTSRVTLVGQIQNRKQPGKRLGGVPALLFSGKQVVGRRSATRWGNSRWNMLRPNACGFTCRCARPANASRCCKRGQPGKESAGYGNGEKDLIPQEGAEIALRRVHHKRHPG